MVFDFVRMIRQIVAPEKEAKKVARVEKENEGQAYSLDTPKSD